MMNKILDKVGSGGVWLAALSCTACFPALGSLASALGLGFLSHFEGISVNTLLPLFAALALLVNSYNWYQHKHVVRGILHVPAHSDHPFRFNPITDFGLIRSPISELSDQK